MPPRILLVTGSNSGIGSAIVRNFLEESDHNIVWAGFHHRQDRVQPIADEFPGRCCPVSLDVSVRAAWQQAVSRIVDSAGRLDVLVNNAGVHEDALLGAMSLDSWDRVLATNLDAVFHGCQAVLPQMISQRSGRIINVASLSALLAPVGQTNYAAAKAGVVALTQSLAKETARMGITVNAICPGYIETEALESMPPEKRQSALAQIPMRRFGRPSEVASLVRFLACPDAAYLTGSAIKIDGGIL